MRIAVIGAGIIGVTTAFELASDGHDVAVFDRRGSIAAESSFAPAGAIAPAALGAWTAPGMPRNIAAQCLGHPAALRFDGLSVRAWPWLWRWWRAQQASNIPARRQLMHRLARFSQSRIAELTLGLKLDYEHQAGQLILLRTARDLAALEPGLKLLTEVGEHHEVVDGARAREIEPGLNPDTALHAAIHLPGDEAANCRQFAHLLRGEAERLGAQFHFDHDVLAIQAGPRPRMLVHRLGDGAGEATRVSPTPVEPTRPPEARDFDAVVLCAAMGALPLLTPLATRLPMVAIHGYSVTAPAQAADSNATSGPLASVFDERHQVSISRLGHRVRVAGGAEWGGSTERMNAQILGQLYKVLNDWFPGAARTSRATQWKGSQPMLPDGLPVLGASAAQGIWLNLGHGASGWALAHASARIVADQLAGRPAQLDATGLGLARLR
jgi:D-amino-acid dehydrogenase